MRRWAQGVHARVPEVRALGGGVERDGGLSSAREELTRLCVGSVCGHYTREANFVTAAHECRAGQESRVLLGIQRYCDLRNTQSR